MSRTSYTSEMEVCRILSHSKMHREMLSITIAATLFVCAVECGARTSGDTLASMSGISALNGKINDSATALNCALISPLGSATLYYWTLHNTVTGYVKKSAQGGARRKTAAWIGARDSCHCIRHLRPRQVRQHSGWPIPDL